MLDYKPNIVLSNEEFNVVGTRPVRPDGAEKVTGRARYGADQNLPGLLYGKILRSPHSHAIIKSVDTSAAEVLPGVHAVVTSADWPETSGRLADLAEGAIQNLGFLSMNVLARGKALYKGHAIAAVAAVNAHVAEQALALIKVDYEVLTPVLSSEEAMKDPAPRPSMRGWPACPTRRCAPAACWTKATTARSATSPTSSSSTSATWRRASSRRTSSSRRRPRQSRSTKGYIEPHAGTAQWGADGKLTIWSSSQGQFTVRDHTARFLGIPIADVKAIPLEIGGGFGAKTVLYVEPVAALLSRKSGHPVKVQMSRKEVFEATGPTSGTKDQGQAGRYQRGQDRRR